MSRCVKPISAYLSNYFTFHLSILFKLSLSIAMFSIGKRTQLFIAFSLCNFNAWWPILIRETGITLEFIRTTYPPHYTVKGRLEMSTFLLLFLFLVEETKCQRLTALRDSSAVKSQPEESVSFIMGERVSERETERINTTFTVDDSSHTWPSSLKHLLVQH